LYNKKNTKRGEKMEYDIYTVMYDIEMEVLEQLKKQIKKGLTHSANNYGTFEAYCFRNIEEYSRKNRKLTNKQFKKLDREIKKVIKECYKQGAASEELNILESVKNGFNPPIQGIGLEAGFFALNEDRINALVDEALTISNNCKTAILRTSDDIYRKIIFECSTYNSLGFTLWESVDRAVNKFTQNGITGITFKNGANWNVASYAEMALRTSGTRARNYGEGAMRESWGIGTVMVSSYGACSKICLPWQGRVYWDDVYGSVPIPEDNTYPLLSVAIEGGLFHPNCRHHTSTYFEGISSPPKKFKSNAETVEHSEAEQKQRYYERKIRENKRQEQMALTQQNQMKYRKKVREYQKKQRDYIKNTNNIHGDEVLRRDYQREKLR
jgi:hypothetical protein